MVLYEIAASILVEIFAWMEACVHVPRYHGSYKSMKNNSILRTYQGLKLQSECLLARKVCEQAKRVYKSVARNQHRAKN